MGEGEPPAAALGRGKGSTLPSPWIRIKIFSRFRAEPLVASVQPGAKGDFLTVGARPALCKAKRGSRTGKALPKQGSPVWGCLHPAPDPPQEVRERCFLYYASNPAGRDEIACKKGLSLTSRRGVKGGAQERSGGAPKGRDDVF